MWLIVQLLTVNHHHLLVHNTINSL